MNQRIIVGISGASGIVYAARTLELFGLEPEQLRRWQGDSLSATGH